MSGVAAGRFSYAGLDPEAETIARSAATAIKSVMSRSVAQIGRHLIVAKEALPHGAFTAWAEAELGITSRSCRNYMAATEWLEGKPETVSVLPPSVIYTLASPSAPAELIDDVVAMGQAGEIDLATVRRKIDNFKSEQIDLRCAQRRSPKLTVAGLRAQKMKHREHGLREQERFEHERELDRAKRKVRLRSLAERVASLGPETVGELLAALGNYQDAPVLAELGREILAAGQA